MCLAGNEINYPLPFQAQQIDLNDPDELFRLVQIIELYPILVDRVEEQEGLLADRQELMGEKNGLIEEYEEKNNYLKNKGELWFYIAVIGIPVVALLGLGGGIWVGISFK